LVHIADGRQHRVYCLTEERGWRLKSIVARAAALANIDDVPLRAWRKNRATKLVGFRVDERGRLLGEAWVPRAGITAEEFQLYVRTVAAESDHLEHVLTGADRE
jgi:hypothetical protein